ncbi:MAG: deoxyribose-phosphate aldolase [Acidibrevibacterium sp.]|uniref:deoxyribose-phosphate aldolase n=1 Tax=Acidibrevibacterium sp. TaxID=2606776 RepID=UPI003D07CD59
MNTAGEPLAPDRLAAMIDHTLLRPDATPADVSRLCAEATACGFHAVCVNPLWVAPARRALAAAPVAVCSVIAFPFGATPSANKAAEAARAVADGASEIDMVIAIGALKAGDHEAVRADIAAVRQAVPAALLKVILETALLTEGEKVAACSLAVAAGADFVKTSTGYGGGGATAADVALMRRIVGPKIGVKASGGIRDLAAANAMIAAGASRIGASASLVLVGAAKTPADSY